jgi:hypothetical protein
MNDEALDSAWAWVLVLVVVNTLAWRLDWPFWVW